MGSRDLQLSEVDSPAAWQRVGLAVAVGTIGSIGMWSMPVALPFVQADFGLTRADASLPYTLAMMGFAVGGVAMGRLCDTFGVVVTITLGCLALGGGYVGASIVPSPLTFALMHLFIGVGASATFGPLMADMSHWFLRHRGIAVGLAASGDYIGGALWPPLLQHAMATVGWRQTYFSVGLFCVLATMPFIIAPAATSTNASDRIDARGGAQSQGFAQRADGFAVHCGSCLLRGNGDAAGPHRRLLR